MPPEERASPASSTAASVLSGAADSFGFDPADHRGRGFQAGDRIGPVRILGFVGAGGMGLVYEALQDSPSRRVALKLLRLGNASPSATRRFAQEADLLARLQHPQIAQVYLAGLAVTPAGEVPYLVMEFLVGAGSILDHAERKGLTGRERVALVSLAVAAVAHAHRSGVVHRDLKPGNILVDEAGCLRVIDFGVARLLEADGSDRSAATEAGELLGTVRYMSPEQLGLDQAGVGPRSDVYALGLVIHELLLGELPYELRGRSLPEAVAILGRQTALDVGPLARRLTKQFAAADARPLAVIVAKCLEPDAERRYADAGELHADLDRWLAGEPIRARPPTFSESVLRLARRHRPAAVAAATALAALLIAAAGIGWFSLAAAHQRRVADAARLAAEQALDAAEKERRLAQAQAREARHQLYLSTVLLAAEARDRDNLTEARRLLAEASELAVESNAETPELDCLAASLDEALAVWQGDGATIQSVAWAPAGDLAAIGTAAGNVWLWQPGDDGDRPLDTEAGPPLVTHDGPVWGVAFSPSGGQLASASADSTVRVTDRSSGDLVASLAGHEAAVYDVRFSPAGDLLASCSRDGSVRLWATATWEPLAMLEGHAATVFSVCFSPDGSSLLTTSRDGTARLWDVATRREKLAVFHGDTRVFRGAFSSDGSRFATAADDATARVWDAADGKAIAVLSHPLRVNAAAFLPDDRLATASGDGLLRIWDIPTARQLDVRRGHAAGIWSLARAADATLAITGSADGTSRLWNLASDGGPVVDLGGRGLVVSRSPAGNFLAVGLANDGVALLNSASLEERQRLLAPEAGRINDLAFTTDSGTVFAACDDGAVRCWRLPEGAPLPSLPLHRRRIYSVALSPDGGTLATASEDRSARLVDVRTGVDRTSPLKHPRRVFAAAFAPDGRTIATACEDRLVRLWSVADGRELASLAGHEGPVNWVCFSPDGSRLASASSDGTVRLWPSDGPTAPAVLTGPSRQIWKVTFSPRGTRVAACSADGTVQLWDAASGRPVATLRGHRDQVWGVAFRPDGHGLDSTSWDGTLRSWGVSAATLAETRAAEGRAAEE